MSETESSIPSSTKTEEAAAESAGEGPEDGPALWETAQTFEDLCELTARWIEGDIKYVPGYGGETVEEETKRLVPVLAALNRAGFLTNSSQPGEITAYGRQRAYVSGLALEPVARRLAKLGLCTDLIAIVDRPGEEGGYLVPVTVDNFRPFTWAVTEPPEMLAAECSTKARGVLKKAWSVMIFDPKWGRQEYLWKHLARELCYDVTPTDDVLETDFIA